MMRLILMCTFVKFVFVQVQKSIFARVTGVHLFASLKRNMGMEGKDKSREPIYSRRLKAGKRHYYFDAKRDSHGNEYVVITESKSVDSEEGIVKRQRLFLYKEDFQKFYDCFKDVLGFFGGVRDNVVAPLEGDNVVQSEDNYISLNIDFDSELKELDD